MNNVPLLLLGHISFIHLAVDGHLACLHFLATMNYAAVNVPTQGLCGQVFISLEYLPTSRIAGSYGNSSFNSFNMF